MTQDAYQARKTLSPSQPHLTVAEGVWDYFLRLNVLDCSVSRSSRIAEMLKGITSLRRLLRLPVARANCSTAPLFLKLIFYNYTISADFVGNIS